MIPVVILLRFALRSGAIKGGNMQIFVDADACPVVGIMMLAVVLVILTVPAFLSFYA